MSTSNDDMPANLGLWDQNLALKWVQNHIKDFGGNPDQVSLHNTNHHAFVTTLIHLIAITMTKFQVFLAVYGFD
jgi:hypothetical protein